jgi:CRISPR-associated endonuclease/helicase Cas3
LQRKFGRWGLAYLESLLRAADYAASAKPSEFVEDRK